MVVQRVDWWENQWVDSRESESVAELADGMAARLVRYWVDHLVDQKAVRKAHRLVDKWAENWAAHLVEH